MTDRPYHHGDLRRAVLAAAVAAIAESGPAGVSLRDLARRAGVSHAAPAHHFGDKAGLITAVATEGYRLLDEALTGAWERTGSFLEMGVAYVRFATEHRAHFEVMFRPDLYRADDRELLEAQRLAASTLSGGVRSLPDARAGDDPAVTELAAWSLVHGFATLLLSGILGPQIGDDPEGTARAVAEMLLRGLTEAGYRAIP